MAEFAFLPFTLAIKVRLVAAELQSKKRTIRIQQIRRQAGQMAEAMRASGEPRWRAVQVEDAFVAMTLARLDELDEAERQGGPRLINVTPIRAERKTA